MFASVIFTTYNHPGWLEKTLWGFSAQSWRDFEIIVADDGSGPETRAVVESMQRQIDIPIRHIWQEDDGFQKCRVLNKAIVASRGEYLIFTDGDCIPHPDFVRNHVELAAENTLLSANIQYLDTEYDSFVYFAPNQGLPPNTTCPFAPTPQTTPGGSTINVFNFSGGHYRTCRQHSQGAHHRRLQLRW